MQASWNGTVVAQSEDTVVVEGNHYFPPDALADGYFEPSTHTCLYELSSPPGTHSSRVPQRSGRTWRSRPGALLPHMRQQDSLLLGAS